MRTCSQCGARLADSAQYCMQCGTAAGTSAPGSPESDTASYFRPALIAGGVLGALSAIPIVQWGNCICCMWAVGGGALGAWLLGRERPGGWATLPLGDGAFVGVLSGLFGGVVATIIGIPFRLLAAFAMDPAEIEELILEAAPGIDPELLERILQFSESPLIFVLASLVFNVILFSLFAMVGGILFAAIAGNKGADKTG